MWETHHVILYHMIDIMKHDVISTIILNNLYKILYGHRDGRAHARRILDLGLSTEEALFSGRSLVDSL